MCVCAFARHPENLLYVCIVVCVDTILCVYTYVHMCMCEVNIRACAFVLHVVYAEDVLYVSIVVYAQYLLRVCI